MDATPDDHVADILAHLPARPGARFLLALAGPPATGKSTLAERLTQRLSAQGRQAALLPMDGFHLDNRLLAARGLLARKGAPETFDSDGFLAMIRRVKAGGEVVVPVFDRDRDIAIAGAAIIGRETGIVVVEGNYLLFDRPPWRDLAALWDLSVFLTAPEPTLRDRLVARWLHHGLDAAAALARAEANDLPNARLILAHRLPASLVL